jgi:two-component system, LuxR family, sensor kinase FixL
VRGRHAPDQGQKLVGAIRLLKERRGAGGDSAGIRANKSVAKVDMQIAAELPNVRADKVAMQQVIVNLIRNAVEAMEGCPRRELTLGAGRDLCQP